MTAEEKLAEAQSFIEDVRIVAGLMLLVRDVRGVLGSNDESRKAARLLKGDYDLVKLVRRYDELLKKSQAHSGAMTVDEAEQVQIAQAEQAEAEGNP